MAGKSIFLITVLTTWSEHSSTYFGKRSVGWTATLEEATKIIYANRANVNEGKYTFAVIEEVESGVYRDTLNEHWYMWKKEDAGNAEGYREIEWRPRQFFTLRSFWAMSARVPL